MSNAYIGQASLRFLSAVLTAAAVSAATLPAHAGVTVTAVGDADFIANPTWRPVDFNFYSESMDFSRPDFFVQAARILPEPFHKINPRLYIGPGAAHAGPYDHEISDGIAAAGVQTKEVFTPAEFDGINKDADGFLHGVVMAFMIVADPANAPTGMTPDGVMTPIIPNALFKRPNPDDPDAPFTWTFTDSVFKDGAPVAFDGPFSFPQPPLDGDIDPAFANVEGYTHFPFFFEEDSSFVPPALGIVGDYRYEARILDSYNNGFIVEGTYSIRHVPEPTTLSTIGIGICALMASRRRLRRDDTALRRS